MMNASGVFSEVPKTFCVPRSVLLFAYDIGGHFIRDVAVPNREIHRPAFLSGSRAACEEVHDHRNDGEQQEDMN